ncbi:hypothetical protein D3C85_1621580 [compost metagenome]
MLTDCVWAHRSRPVKLRLRESLIAAVDRARGSHNHLRGRVLTSGFGYVQSPCGIRLMATSGSLHGSWNTSNRRQMDNGIDSAGDITQQLVVKYGAFTEDSVETIEVFDSAGT